MKGRTRFGRAVHVLLRLREAAVLLRWADAGFAPPAPTRVKRAVLRRHGVVGAPWVETGTYLGDMAAHLAATGARIITLEPMPELFLAAQARLAHLPRVQVRNETSQAGFLRAARDSGPEINFWLDGHYSGEGTHRGGSDTPILEELMAIALLVQDGIRVAVFIDDVRLFVEEWADEPASDRPGYPSLDDLVTWATDAQLRWTVEHDIFVAVST